MLTFEQLAETFSPGEAIKEELEERGWSQRDLAAIMGVQPSVVSAIVNGTKPVSLDLARNLAAAFGTSAHYWVNMETAYRLHQSPALHSETTARSELFKVAPVNEMIKRGWIVSTNDVDVLRARVEAFFDRSIPEIEEGELAYAARQGTDYGKPNAAQRAWVRRVRILGRAVHADAFTSDSVGRAIANLRPLMEHAEECRHVPRILAECGIRFIVVEHLPQTRIDGVCLWLDEQKPVIALSLRYDRLDYFWFTLMHELGHVAQKDGLTAATVFPDIDLVGDNAMLTSAKPPCEQMADAFATENTIKQSELDLFIARVKPLFSKAKIQGFAIRLHVHPALVIGQLQHRKAIHWSHSREFLVKVREIIASSALTDGWGQILPNIT